jgi:NADH:ubiquinone oxidoreductase subunit 5 (subunit L)/multisubunit Na+/H+ antiporter MnhA subunit
MAGRWSADAAARLAAGLVAAGWVAVVVLAVIRLARPSADTTLKNTPFHFDALALVMLLLVLGLSALIQFFAVRYLRGDVRQTWFVVSVNVLTASTAVLVCAATVLSFGLAWLAAGVSLVALLGTYPQLEQARDGVRKTAIRLVIADVFLVAAMMVIVVQAGGDVRLTALGPAVAGLPSGLGIIVVLCLVVPALARSSQVPFHGWLPATLAAPTPVSALMHAGVVNAGAILIVRFAPAIGESTPAMALIFCAGALTLAYASLVRLIKPDVKGRLVFSTMAQMGFMMLACGLGAFAAAVFHLVAHGLFKSTLFLGAGSGVAREANERHWPTRVAARWPRLAASAGLAVSVPIIAIVGARTVLAIELSPASQALQVFVVFTAAVALFALLTTHFSLESAIVGSLLITGLAFGYTVLVSLFDTLLQIAPAPQAVNAWWLLAPGVVVVALPLLSGLSRHPAGRRLYALLLAAGTPTIRPESTSRTRRTRRPASSSSPRRTVRPAPIKHRTPTTVTEGAPV